MSPLERPTAGAALAVVVTGALFGSSFVAIRAATLATGPFTVASTRMALGALVLLVVTRVQGRWTLGDASDRRRTVLVGAAGFALPFTLLAWAEQTLSSGLAAILLATAPVTGLVLSHVLTEDDRITPRKTVAVVVGFVGVALAIGPGALLSTSSLASALAVLSCGVGYAVGGLVSRRITTAPPDVVAANALVVGTALSAPFSLVLERPWSLTVDGSTALALGWLGVVATGLAWAVRFWQVARYGYTFASFAGFVAPAVALPLGALLLDEDLSGAAVAGLALVLIGRAATLEIRPAGAAQPIET